MIHILILALVGLGMGALIYVVNQKLPPEPEYLKKAEEISDLLPGMNCGACGYAGCFAYAQAVAEDKNIVLDTPCMTVMKNEEAVAKLERKLDMQISCSEMDKIAIVKCTGKSDIKYEYKGINSCKAAAQLAGGYKECPFACLGFGDCAKVCPEGGISIDKEKNVAVIDHSQCLGCGLCAKECPHNLIEIVPSTLPQYVGCSYIFKQNLVGRKRCKTGCTHCKICLKQEPDAVVWDERKDMPDFLTKSKPAPKAIEKCPRKVIIPLPCGQMEAPVPEKSEQSEEAAAAEA